MEEAGSARSTGRRSVAARWLLGGLALGVVLFWLGGVVEILWHDDGPRGAECWAYPFGAESSDVATGTERAKWVGGGVLGRPGLVCEVTPEQVAGRPLAPGYPEQFRAGPVDFLLLSTEDLAVSALAVLAVLVGAGVALAVLVMDRGARAPGER